MAIHAATLSRTSNRRSRSSAGKSASPSGDSAEVSAAAMPGASSFRASSDNRTIRDRSNAAARRFDPGSARYDTNASTSFTSSASKKPSPL